MVLKVANVDSKKLYLEELIIVHNLKQEVFTGNETPYQNCDTELSYQIKLKYETVILFIKYFIGIL